MDVSDGAFECTDNGEWGGELTFIAKDGTRSTLIHGNTQVVTQVGPTFLAASGLDHMMNNGSIYRVTRDTRGVWTAHSVAQASGGTGMGSRTGDQ